jgi:hypothetical protein
MSGATRYGVNDVLAPSDWTLDLPVVAQSREFRLYRFRLNQPIRCFRALRHDHQSNAFPYLLFGGGTDYRAGT